jgi:hypothetical protein
MTGSERHSRSGRTAGAAVLALGIAIAVGACAASGPTAVPGSTGPDASPSIAADPTTPPPAPTTTAAPATTTPTPAEAGPCPVSPRNGRLPSDRMTDVRISSTATSDLVTFVFGPSSFPVPPQGPSEGSLEAALEPYTQAASGLPVDVTGERVAQLRFAGMSLSNDTGQLTYDGPLEFRPDLSALKSVVDYDYSEGVIGWYIGYDGDGCITLSTDSSGVTVIIDHARG